MDVIIKSVNSISSKLSLKEKNILMRLKQIQQDCVREYNQYQVFYKFY